MTKDAAFDQDEKEAWEFLTAYVEGHTMADQATREQIHDALDRFRRWANRALQEEGWQRDPLQCPNCRSKDVQEDSIGSELDGMSFGTPAKQAMDCNACGAHFYNYYEVTDGGLHPTESGSPDMKNKFSPCCGAAMRPSNEDEGNTLVCEDCGDQV